LKSDYTALQDGELEKVREAGKRQKDHLTEAPRAVSASGYEW